MTHHQNSSCRPGTRHMPDATQSPLALAALNPPLRHRAPSSPEFILARHVISICARMLKLSRPVLYSEAATQGKTEMRTLVAPKGTSVMLSRAPHCAPATSQSMGEGGGWAVTLEFCQ